jgi:hypothetical protein
MVFLDKDGRPVVRIKGRWLINIIRHILWTRKIVRGIWDGYKVVRPVGVCSCGRPLLAIRDDSGKQISVTHTLEDDEHHMEYWSTSKVNERSGR